MTSERMLQSKRESEFIIAQNIF